MFVNIFIMEIKCYYYYYLLLVLIPRETFLIDKLHF